MKIGLDVIPMSKLDEIILIGKRAEAYDFYCVLISDHVKNRALWVCLSALALNTKKIKIGSGITNPYSNHPALIAQNLATLDEIAKNRVICGIGAGDEEALKSIGIKRERPLTYVRESFGLIRAYLKGLREYEGKIFKLKNFKSNFTTIGNIPLFIGAQGKLMLKLAGEMGDGVLINSSNVNYCSEAIETVNLALKERRSLEFGFEYGTISPYSVANSYEEAKRIIAPIVGTVVAGCNDYVLQKHGIRIEDKERVLKAIESRDLELIRKSVKDDMIENFSVTGKPEDCLEKMEELKKIGISLFIGSLPSTKFIHDAMKLTKEKVLSYFQNKGES
ncbi:MAG: 5,10-methylenetetrahydromethanopterin reductase [Nitrososphaerales archaeon]